MNDDVKDEGVECEICYDTGIVFDGKKDYLACICDRGKELNLKSGGKFTKIGQFPKKNMSERPPIHFEESDMTLEDMMSGMPYPDEDSVINDEEGDYD